MLCKKNLYLFFCTILDVSCFSNVQILSDLVMYLYHFFCTFLDVSCFSKLQILNDLVMFGMYFLVDLTTVDFPHFLRQCVEANFSISLTIFEVMDLIILKDIPSWKQLRSDVLKTNKNYIPNITRSIKIFIFEQFFRFRIVQKKVKIFFAQL